MSNMNLDGQGTVWEFEESEDLAQETKPVRWEFEPTPPQDRNMQSLVTTANKLTQGKNDMAVVVEEAKKSGFSYEFTEETLNDMLIASHDRTQYVSEQSRLADKYFPKTKQFMTGEGATSIAAQWKDIQDDRWYERPFTEMSLANEIGYLSLDVNRIQNRMFWDIATPDEIKKLDEYREKLSAYSQLREDENFFTKAWREMFATFVPQVMGMGLNTAKRSAQGMLIGAGAGATTGAIIGTVAPGIGNIAGALAGAGTGGATGIITGAKLGAAEYSFGQSLGEVYGSLSQMRNSDGEQISPEVARVISVAGAAGMAGLDMIGLTKMLDLIPGMDKVLSGKAVSEATKFLQKSPDVMKIIGESGMKVLTALGVEAITEMGQESIVAYSEQALRKYSKSQGDTTLYATGEEIQRRVMDAGEMAFASVFFPTALGGIGRGVYSYREVQKAQAQAKIEREGLANLARGVQETELRTKAPNLLQEVLKQTTGGASTYIEPQALQVLFQTEDGIKIAESAGITPDMVADAINLKVDVAVPIHKQTDLMASTFWKQIEPYSKLTPTSPNQEQAQNLFSQDMSEVQDAMQDNGFLSFLDEVDAEYTRKEMWKESSSDYIYQLEQAGYTPLQAESMGLILGAHAEVFAPIYGQTPKEFLAQRLAHINAMTPKQFPDAARRFKQGETVDLMGEREAEAVSKMQQSVRPPIVENLWGQVDSAQFKKTFGKDAYNAIVKRYGRKFFAKVQKDESGKVVSRGMPLDAALVEAQQQGLIGETTNPDEVAAWLGGDSGAILFQGGTAQRLAPNGKPSNLTPELWETVRTPEFKAWFGDWENDPENASKVVDENGEPLVVYHGTNTPYKIEEFKKKTQRIEGESGFFFTGNLNQAKEFSGSDKSRAKVIPTFLNIKNILVRDFNSQRYSNEKFKKIFSEVNSQDGILIKSVRDRSIVADQYVAFSPNQIKSIENQGTFSAESDNIYYQSQQTHPLIVTHGIDASNILEADKLGGLPVPSLAVVKADEPLTNYGNVILIGNEAMLEDAPVFSSDAYTARFPKLLWDGASYAKVKPFEKELRAVAEELGETSDPHSVIYLIDERPDKPGAISQFKRSLTGKVMFLRSIGQDVEIAYKKEKVITDPFAQPAILEVVKEIDSDELDINSPVYAKLSKVYVDYVNSMDGSPRLKELFLNNIDQETGNLFFSPADQLVHYAKQHMQKQESGKKEVDTFTTEKNAAQLIRGQEDAFNAYAEEKVGQYFGEPKIQLGRKKVPLTLDNVVEAMTSRKIKGQEETMGFGNGELVAKRAKKFKNIEEVKKNRTKIVTEEEGYGFYKENIGELLDQFRSAVSEYYAYPKSYDQYDEAMRALSEVPKKITSGAVAAKLTKHDFNDVPQEILEMGVQALEEIDRGLVNYFEAKPQRAVDLSEFSGAVVPGDVDPAVLEVLDKNGIPYTFYAGGDSEMAGAVASFSRRLGEEQEGVLFQGRSKATPETARGVIMRRDTDSAFMIGLFKGKKDISTIVHEGAGHFFLENLREAASMPNAPEWVVNNWLTIADAIGADIDPTKDIPSDAHEAYARMATKYFTQGKAPSSELQNVMRLFGRWLASIYRQVKRIFSDLQDIPQEVQDAMDRLIATEADLEKVGNTFDLDAVQDVDIAEPNKWMQYNSLLVKAKKDAEAVVALRRLGAEMRIEKEAKLEAKILMTSDRGMLEVMRVKNMGGMRYDDVSAAFGEESMLDLWDKWNRSGGSQLIRKSGGKLSVDEAMQELGFDDQFQLLAWLLDSKTEKDFETEIVDARLKEFSDNYDPVVEAMGLNAADQALSERDAVLSGQEQVSTSALADSMQERVEAMPLDSVDAEYGALRSGEERIQAAKKLSSELVKKQETAKQRKESSTDKKITDLKDAYNERLERQKTKADSKLDETIGAERKRRAALVAAYKTRMERDDIIRKVRRLASQKNINDPFYQQILRLVSRFGGLGTPTMQARESTPLLADFWAEWAINNGFDTAAVPQVPEWLVGLGERAKVRFNELSIEQMRDVHTILKQLKHQADSVDKLMGMLQQATIDGVVEETTAPMNLLPEKRHIDAVERETWLGKVRQSLRKSHADKTTLRYVWQVADGGVSKGSSTEVGANQRLNFNQLQDAEHNERKLLREFSTKMREILGNALQGVDMTTPFKIPGVVIAEDVAKDWRNMWTMERVFTLALNMGNKGNRNAIQSGYGLDDQSLNLILDRMTPELWDAVQKTWDMLEEMYPALSETYEQIYGVPMSKVKVEPITVNMNGVVTELRGGYYPLVFDGRFSDKAADQQALENLAKLNSSEAVFRTPSPKSGMTKDRKGGLLPPKLSIDVLPKHIQESIHYTTHAIPLRNVFRIMKDARYKSSFVRAFGVEMYEAMTNNLIGIGRPNPRLESFGDGFIDRMAKNGTIFALGLSFRTALMGFTSISNSMHRVGMVNFLDASAKLVARPFETWSMVGDLSPYMRERSTLYDRDVRATVNNLFGTGKTINVLGMTVDRSRLESSFFAMISAVDAVVARPTWLAMHNKALAEGKNIQDAVRLADSAVLEAQAGGGLLDTSNLMRNPGAMRLFTVFMTFTSNQYNRNASMYRSWQNYRKTQGEGSVVTFKDFAMYVAMTTLVPSLAVSWMIGYGMDGEEPEMKDYVWEMLSMLTGGMPFIRLAVSATRFDGVNFSALKGLETAAKSFVDGVNMATGYKRYDDEAMYRFLKNTINAAGFFTGIPTAQLFRTLEGTEAFMEGDTGPLAPLFGKPYKKKGQETLFD